MPINKILYDFDNKTWTQLLLEASDDIFNFLSSNGLYDLIN